MSEAPPAKGRGGAGNAPEILPLHLADVIQPQGSSAAGETHPVFGYLVRTSESVVLVDTGIGPDIPLIRRLYQPLRREIGAVLAKEGVEISDVTAVINTHLHFDHCGGNALFGGVPLFVQAREYEAARERMYTVPEWVDFRGASYELIEGQMEISPGLVLVPSPGHTPGHQSLWVRSGEGDALIVGQAAYTAAEYDDPDPGHVLGLPGAWSRDLYLESLERLHALGATRAYFSHDPIVWEPGEKPSHP